MLGLGIYNELDSKTVETMLGSLYIHINAHLHSLYLLTVPTICIHLNLQITNFRKQLPIAKFTQGSFHSPLTLYLTAVTMVNQGNSSAQLPSSRRTTPDRSMSDDPSRAKCSCGTGDGTGDYIECDNETCKVGWYHWECVQVTGPITGTWLCPSCSPSAAFYIKQLVQNSAAPSPTPKVEKTGGRAALSSAPRHKSTAERAGSKGKEQQPVAERKMKEVANKGVAVKKPAAKKPKPKWIGWVEMTSDGEEEFKKTVDAQWSVEDVVLGKRTRASKSMEEENGTSSRTLRRNSRRKIIETDSEEEEKPVYQRDQQEEAADSEESVYQEEEKEEVRVQRRVSVLEIPSDDSNDSEDTMDMDEGAKDADKGIADEPFDTSTNSAGERQFSPDLVRTDLSPDQDGKSNVSEVEIEGLEDIMDESHDAVGSDLSDGSEYVDDENSSASTEVLVTAPKGREVADSHSPPPASLPATNSAGPSAVSPILQVSEQATQLEDAIEVDAENESHEDEVSVITPPMVDFATVYKRQGNCWGEFRESAIRSTLPRLG